jgi:hypothetical protein
MTSDSVRPLVAGPAAGHRAHAAEALTREELRSLEVLKASATP